MTQQCLCSVSDSLAKKKEGLCSRDCESDLVVVDFSKSFFSVKMVLQVLAKRRLAFVLISDANSASARQILVCKNFEYFFSGQPKY